MLCREHYVGWDAPQNVLDATRYRQKPGIAKRLAELMDVRARFLISMKCEFGFPIKLQLWCQRNSTEQKVLCMSITHDKEYRIVVPITYSGI